MDLQENIFLTAMIITEDRDELDWFRSKAIKKDWTSLLDVFYELYDIYIKVVYVQKNYELLLHENAIKMAIKNIEYYLKYGTIYYDREQQHKELYQYI